MKLQVIVLFAFVTYTAARPNPYIDVFRNTLTSEARVLGGNDALRHQFPHQLSLRWSLVGIKSHICGASLIAMNWALTAAHCKTHSVGSYDVVAGALKRLEAHEDHQTAEVDEFIVHPGYPGGVATNDIALLKLGINLVLGDAVQVIGLGSGEECNDTSQRATLSGWGYTIPIGIVFPNHLQFAELQVISNEECAEKLKDILGTSEPLDDSMVCTGQDGNGTQSACNGDSGGPLIGNLNQIGIVSWGIIPCGYREGPSVYTSVCSHRDWLNQTISSS